MLAEVSNTEFILALLSLAWFAFKIIAVVFLMNTVIFALFTGKWREYFSPRTMLRGLLLTIVGVIALMVVSAVAKNRVSAVKNWLKED